MNAKDLSGVARNSLSVAMSMLDEWYIFDSLYVGHDVDTGKVSFMLTAHSKSKHVRFPAAKKRAKRSRS